MNPTKPSVVPFEPKQTKILRKFRIKNPDPRLASMHLYRRPESAFMRCNSLHRVAPVVQAPVTQPPCGDVAA